ASGKDRPADGETPPLQPVPSGNVANGLPKNATRTEKEEFVLQRLEGILASLDELTSDEGNMEVTKFVGSEMSPSIPERCSEASSQIRSRIELLDGWLEKRSSSLSNGQSRKQVATRRQLGAKKGGKAEPVW